MLRAQAAIDDGDPGAVARIERLQEDLAALDRDREAELARQLSELAEQLTAAEQRVAEATEIVEERARSRAAAETALEGVRTAVRDAERAAEQARREAARVGGELAGVNQFLRNQAGALRGAPPLSDALGVDPGYELALAAALDGRLAAAVVDGRDRAETLLDAAGADGGRALVSDPPPATPASGSDAARSGSAATARAPSRRGRGPGAGPSAAGPDVGGR